MTDQTFKSFQDVMSQLFNSMFTPLIGIAISLCAIYGVYLGFKFWRSGGDENKRKEAKTAVIYFFIGIFVIFIVVVGAPILIKALIDWRDNNSTLSVIYDYCSYAHYSLVSQNIIQV